MKNTQPKLGKQEMAVLRYVAEHAPIAARDAADEIGQEKSLARTTVLTVLERLRQKGYLTRRRREGIFHYIPRESQSELLKNLVGQFIETTLGGEVAPIVAYLSVHRKLSDGELAELEKLVGELKTERVGKKLPVEGTAPTSASETSSDDGALMR